QQCIEEAVNNNTSLKISRLNVEMQRNTLQQAKASMLPTLTANASHGYNWGQTIDLYTNQFASERVQTNNFYLQTGVTLFNGFRLLNMATQQHLNLMARQLDSDQALNDIMLNVATAYMQVLYSTEQLNVADGQLGITQQQLTRTRQLVEGGMLARGELLALEAQVAAEEVNVVRAENALDLAYLTLSQVMNLPAGSAFQIAIPGLDSLEISQTLLLTPIQIYHTALGIQPRIKASEVMVAGADAGVKAARGGALPTLFLSGSLGTGFSGARKDYTPTFSGFAPNGMFTSSFDTVYAPEFTITETLRPFGNQINDNFNQSVALYLSIPIFSGLQNHTAIKNARLSLANARYNLEIQQQQLFQEIQQAHADANAAMKNYLAAKKSLDALNESFLYASERFSVGMINSLEYNDAKNRLMAAEAQMLGARYEYIFKTRLLDFFMGKEITL
ncbi:MAG: TolC family protein, partial [Bacteroidales bacterium]